MGTKTKLYIFLIINHNITANTSSINECINKWIDLGLPKPNTVPGTDLGLNKGMNVWTNVHYSSCPFLPFLLWASPSDMNFARFQVGGEGSPQQSFNSCYHQLPLLTPGSLGVGEIRKALVPGKVVALGKEWERTAKRSVHGAYTSPALPSLLPPSPPPPGFILPDSLMKGWFGVGVPWWHTDLYMNIPKRKRIESY